METTTGSRSVFLGWKLLLLIPLAVGVVLAVIGSRQTDLHAGNKLTIIANLFVPVSFIATVTAGGGLMSRETTDQL
jgi:hypothetical protein